MQVLCSSSLPNNTGSSAILSSSFGSRIQSLLDTSALTIERPNSTDSTGKWFPSPVSSDCGSGTCLRCKGGREDSVKVRDLLEGCRSDLVKSSIYRFLDSDEDLISQVENGFVAGHAPALIENCCGGTYFLKDERGQTFAVFKPADEEPYGPENPKGFVGPMFDISPMKEGVEVGRAAERECAAYLLDHGGRAQVPRTLILKIELPFTNKHGSLQKFVRNLCTAEDMGPSKFLASDVHYIAMLDIRLCNSDRHVGNILVVEDEDDGRPRLVPIDHGYVLPKWRFLHDLDFCWLHWPQAKLPFTEEELEYIRALDADAESEFLHTAVDLHDSGLRTLRIGTALLKIGAELGLNLYQIGSMMVRSDPDTRSILEEEVSRAEDLTFKEVRRYPLVMRMVSNNANSNNGSHQHHHQQHASCDTQFMRHLTISLHRLCAKAAAKAGVKPPPADGGITSGGNNHHSESGNNNNSNSPTRGDDDVVGELEL